MIPCKVCVCFAICNITANEARDVQYLSFRLYKKCKLYKDFYIKSNFRERDELLTAFYRKFQKSDLWL